MKKIKKISSKYMLLAIALTLAISGTITAIDPQSVFAQAATSTVVSTELINYYSMTTSEVQKFMTTLKDQGITTLTLRINSYSEFTSNSNTAISKIKTIIPIANAYGISVNIDLHTWYTTWDNKFRDSASDSATNRNIYINYVKTTLAALNGYNVNAFMVLNEPQARTASNSENSFILNVIAAARSVTTRPISVRFMGGYSPSTGHYSSAIDQATDFLCRNSYWDARQPTVSVYGCTETKLLTALNTAHNQNKELWITEFGKSNSNLAEQQSYVKAFVSYAKSKGIDAIFCWVSQPESSGETYNIFNGYTPNPAFYELTNTAAYNPTPSPTINPTPSPSSTPTQTPSPSSTPTPSQPPSTAGFSTLYEDDFEAKTLNGWNEITTSRADSVTIADYAPYSGNYHARFYTSGSYSGIENAFISKNVDLSTVAISGQFYLTGYRSESLLRDNGDRLYLIRLETDSGNAVLAGIKRENGINKWTLNTDYDQTSREIPIEFNNYYNVTVYYNAVQHTAELFVDGQKILESNIETGTEVNRIDLGIISAYRVQNRLIVYGDNFILRC